MSIKYMAAGYDMALKPSQREVYMAMADHADHDGNNIFPALGLIAWKIDMDVRNVRRVIRQLEDIGLLVLDRKGQGRVTNLWHIDLSKAPAKLPYKPQNESGQIAPSDRIELCPVRPGKAMSAKPSLTVNEPPGSPPDGVASVDAYAAYQQEMIAAPMVSHNGNGKHPNPKVGRKKQLPQYGDLMVAIRDWTGVINGRAGDIAKALLAEYPETTLEEFNRYTAWWDDERGAKGVTKPIGKESLPSSFGAWRKENAPHVPVELTPERAESDKRHAEWERRELANWGIH